MEGEGRGRRRKGRKVKETEGKEEMVLERCNVWDEWKEKWEN